jgi:carbamoyl-phosphate synthase large subunit
VLAVAVCLVGFHFGAAWLQAAEARGVVTVLGWLGIDGISGVLPRRILMFRAEGDLINAEVTASCSAILSVLGLSALSVSVLRGRRQHALAGLVVAVVAMLALNHLRLLGSALAGVWWGDSALVLFHDWVGTLWNFAATLLGFLLMVCVTLPAAERAEQDVAGRHTARRPDSWARPGLGYRQEAQARPRSMRLNLTGLLHRYVLPKRVSRWLGARRETARIDYRLGHLPPAERGERVRALAADGLGVHTATLLAVATYEADPEVLDCLAEAVAARQWEPVTNQRIASLRLWARGWLLARPPAPDAPPAPVTPVAAERARPSLPPVPTPADRGRPAVPRPRSFARPPLVPPVRNPTPEETS